LICHPGEHLDLADRYEERRKVGVQAGPIYHERGWILPEIIDLEWGTIEALKQNPSCSSAQAIGYPLSVESDDES
jgi:hypothetical protein